ncbi:MAG: mannose-1-phosphate guanylyltransferase/mannose-6-phosphate isomerase [Candidatus Sericytochromatia bacterium]
MQYWQPVILCGGSGTRLWPLSREAFPKQFVQTGSAPSLFQQTLMRFQDLQGVQTPLVVSHENHRFLVAEQLRQLAETPAAILLEPIARNTAPALTLAALWAQAQNPESLLLVLPADHAMQNPSALRDLLPRAGELAAAGKIVTFGIQPDRPETGYGYILAEEEKIVAFIEKPNLSQAQTYLNQGNYLWNSGMIALKAQTWLQEMQIFAPDILQACQAAFAAGQKDMHFFRPEAHAFEACPALACDYAVLEKTQRAAVLKLNAGWSDVGSWDAFQALLAQDGKGNACHGDVLTFQAQNNLLFSQSRLLTAVGVEDLIVVETPDAVLVTHRSQAQNVKEAVLTMQQMRRPEVENHTRVARPWGFYETVDQGERFQVKRITVHPGQALSKQMHHHRSEHWVVVKGTARVTCGEKIALLTENESVYIPVGTIHRLENPGNIDLELIEVQSGAYLGEDDIVRFEDRYQRR